MTLRKDQVEKIRSMRDNNRLIPDITKIYNYEGEQETGHKKIMLFDCKYCNSTVSENHLYSHLDDCQAYLSYEREQRYKNV